VSVLIEGINLGWRDDDLATFVRDHGGFDIPILSAKVFYYKGNQTGTGRVVVGTYEDAAKLKKNLHNFAYENRVTHVTYENELFDVSLGIHQWVRGFGIWGLGFVAVGKLLFADALFLHKVEVWGCKVSDVVHGHEFFSLLVLPQTRC
jgi:hypothetical protein